MGVGGQHHTQTALRPGKKPDIYCTGVWVVSKATLNGCEEEKKIFLPSGFEHRTLQPVASRYFDLATSGRTVEVSRHE